MAMKTESDLGITETEKALETETAMQMDTVMEYHFF